MIIKQRYISKPISNDLIWWIILSIIEIKIFEIWRISYKGKQTVHSSTGSQRIVKNEGDGCWATKRKRDARFRDLRESRQVRVGEYVKRRKALENFVPELDVACRLARASSHRVFARAPELARVDPFQSKADQHSSRLDYSPGISSLASSPC